jgi:hypothetical protein
VKEKPTLGPSFLGVFPSDRIPKATKDVKVHFFIHSSNSCKYTSEFRELFESITYTHTHTHTHTHKYIYIYIYMGRDSAVGIATRYGLDGPGIESRWGRDFPNQPPVQWALGLSRR